MKIRNCFLLAILLLLIGVQHTAVAQVSNTTSNNNGSISWVNPQSTNIHEFNFIGGYSFHSTRGFWGKIPETTLSIFTLRYNRKLFAIHNRHFLEYVTELNIAANYTVNNSRGYQESTFTGVGFSPVGFQLNFGKKQVVQPFIKSSAGFMYFSKRFPDERGVRFNFTLELGGGLEFIIAENLSLTVGYKYHHMSNGEFGQINPGVDSNIFYTGFTIF